MQTLIAIFVGGGLGSLARYGLHKWLGETEKGFPVGTLVANILACIVLGFLVAWAAKKTDLDPALKAMLMVGFCGGFSTFSTFSNESFGLFSGDKPLLGFAYIAISVIVCLAGIWLGSSLFGLLANSSAN